LLCVFYQSYSIWRASVSPERHTLVKKGCLLYNTVLYLENGKTASVSFVIQTSNRDRSCSLPTAHLPLMKENTDGLSESTRGRQRLYGWGKIEKHWFILFFLRLIYLF